ncbi:MAG: hypothetical protein WCR42_13945 [bacterium]
MKKILKAMIKLLRNKIFWGSLIIATWLWVYITLDNVYQTQLVAELIVQLPDDVAIENYIPEKVTFDVEGRGWDLFTAKYFSGEQVCRINLRNLNIIKDTIIITNKQILNSMLLNNNLSTKIVEPNFLTLVTGKIIEKLVPLRSNLIINTRNGYRVNGEIHLKPRKIYIRGNAKLVDKIDYWFTEKKIYDDMYKSFESTVGVLDTFGTRVYPLKKIVGFAAEIQQTVEITLYDVPVRIKGAISNAHKLYPDKITVTVNGGIAEIEKLEIGSVRAYVNAKDLLEDKRGTIIPKFDLPKNVQVLTFKPKYLNHVYERKN